jgi:hypothetical protein
MKYSLRLDPFHEVVDQRPVNASQTKEDACFAIGLALLRISNEVIQDGRVSLPVATVTCKNRLF